jgi:hypothetical protein
VCAYLRVATAKRFTTYRKAGHHVVSIPGAVVIIGVRAWSRVRVACYRRVMESGFKAGRSVARQGQRNRLPASFLEVNPLASQVSFKQFGAVDRLARLDCYGIYPGG